LLLVDEGWPVGAEGIATRREMPPDRLN